MHSALLRISAAALGALACTGCLDSMEPTRISSVISIDPLNATAAELPATNILHANFRVSNRGAQRLFVDNGYRRLEKLVRQQWRLVDEREGTLVAPIVPVEPNRFAAVAYSIGYDIGSIARQPLLQNLRGVYRVRYRIFLSAELSDTLPADESYSQPFAIDCC